MIGMETTPREAEPKASLYESVACRMADLIERGTFPPGARVPSVRSLSRQWEVSTTTVLEAYRLLEDRGLIEARPQSGYYVTTRFPGAPPEPEISRPAASRRTWSV
jgi:DNA-binding FadR family transcriptional regulator